MAKRTAHLVRSPVRSFAWPPLLVYLGAGAALTFVHGLPGPNLTDSAVSLRQDWGPWRCDQERGGRRFRDAS